MQLITHGHASLLIISSSEVLSGNQYHIEMSTSICFIGFTKGSMFLELPQVDLGSKNNSQVS